MTAGANQIHIRFDVVDGQADQHGRVVSPRCDQHRLRLVHPCPAQRFLFGGISVERTEAIRERAVDRFAQPVDDHDVALELPLREQGARGGAARGAIPADDGVFVDSLVQILHVTLLGTAHEVDRELIGEPKEENEKEQPNGRQEDRVEQTRVGRDGHNVAISHGGERGCYRKYDQRRQPQANTNPAKERRARAHKGAAVPQRRFGRDVILVRTGS
jgi:hypothetical protein